MNPDGLSELTAARDLAERLDPGMVSPLVHHEQALPGLTGQALGRLGIDGHRLLDIHRDPELKHLVEDVGVRRRWRRDDDAIGFTERVHSLDDPVGARCLGPRDALGRACHDRHATAEPAQVPQDLAAPATATHQSDNGGVVGAGSAHAPDGMRGTIDAATLY